MNVLVMGNIRERNALHVYKMNGYDDDEEEYSCMISIYVLIFMSYSRVEYR